MTGQVRNILVLLGIFFFCYTSRAQSFSVSTNIVDWADFGTMNVEAGLPLSKHFSLHAQARVNPWQFGLKEGDASYEDIVDIDKAGFIKKKTAIGASVRYWPWYVFSGFWVKGKVQFCAYDKGGKFLGQERRIGDAIGGGIGLGYTWMLNANWNIEVGVTGWAGMTSEAIRENIITPKVTDPEWKKFIQLDEVIVAFVYVF